MPPPSRLHLLVVDDEPTVREALALALSGTYAVHTAATGNAACDILRTHPIAAIILDAVLQGEHGLDLVGEFRALSRAPILVVTGYGSEDLVVRALRARVDDYLKKPMKLAELQAALDRLMAHGGNPSDPVARLRSHLDQHRSKAFKAKELAAQFGVSEAHLRRLFRAAHGKTPRRYLLEVRMQRAAVLLRTTQLGIKQIAQEVGYANLVTFGRNFKRVHNMMPSEFRLATPPDVQE